MNASDQTEPEILRQQLEYYRARAEEYDEWFLRTGRYDRGPEHREEWFREVSIVETALQPFIDGAEILELACGTGLWTQRLAARCKKILAVDASPEVIAINRERNASSRIEYLEADIFSWSPNDKFDLVFFSFWLSHVPPSRFRDFWTRVGHALKPGGSAFFIDSLFEPTSTARDHSLNKSGVVQRKLNDGREFQIFKVFYEPELLADRLLESEWSSSISSAGKFFLYGSVKPIV